MWPLVPPILCARIDHVARFYCAFGNYDLILVNRWHHQIVGRHSKHCCHGQIARTCWFEQSKIQNKYLIILQISLSHFAETALEDISLPLSALSRWMAKFSMKYRTNFYWLNDTLSMSLIHDSMALATHVREYEDCHHWKQIMYAESRKNFYWQKSWCRIFFIWHLLNRFDWIVAKDAKQDLFETIQNIGNMVENVMFSNLDELTKYESRFGDRIGREKSSK